MVKNPCYIDSRLNENLSRKKKQGYDVLRNIDLLATASAVPIAMMYCKDLGYDMMGNIFGFISTLYALAVCMWIEQYFYPVNFRGALFTTSVFMLNVITGFFVSGFNFKYGFFVGFYIIIIIQGLITLTVAAASIIPGLNRLSVFQKLFSKSDVALFFIILLIGSPLIAGIFVFWFPFWDTYSQYEITVKYQLGITIGLQVSYNLYRIIKALKNNSGCEEERKILYGKWEGAINMTFFIFLIINFVILIFG